MTTTTELDPFEAAVAAAKGESEEGSSDESHDLDPEEVTDPESSADQAEEDGDEQAESVEGPPEEESTEESESDVDELFGDLEVEAPETEPEAEDNFTLPGIDEPVSLEELKDGYLRQADYTRKTQELAAQRKDAEQAMRFWEVFTSRPQDVARQLAVEAGLIEADAQAVKAVELPFMSEEGIESEVEKRLQAQLAEHPLLQQVQETAADQWIDSEFARIETAYEVQLGPESRQKVLRRAAAQETDNLELVFQAMLYEQQRKQASQEALKKSSPSKPGRKVTGDDTEIEEPDPDADPFEAAVEAAKNELAARRRRS